MTWMLVKQKANCTIKLHKLTLCGQDPKVLISESICSIDEDGATKLGKLSLKDKTYVMQAGFGD